MPAPRQLQLTTTAPEILETEALSRLAEASAILHEIALRRALKKVEQSTPTLGSADAPVVQQVPEARPRSMNPIRPSSARKVVRRFRRNVAP